MIVEPPGWSAQSKSLASGDLPFVCNAGIDFKRSWKAGDTAAAAIAGTRGVRTTFQPLRELAFG